RHKQEADIAGASPGPTKEATEARAVCLAQEHRQQLAVGNARAGLVEGVDLLLEQTNVLRLGVWLNGEVHAAACGNSMSPANQRRPSPVPYGCTMPHAGGRGRQSCRLDTHARWQGPRRLRPLSQQAWPD